MISKLLNLARHLRHGPLKIFKPFWIIAGKSIRLILKKLNIQTPTNHYIGKFGPFKLNQEFIFSDFDNWGNNRNKCFERCIEFCKDKQCILDIGAHIGLFALPISQVINQKAGGLFCFEPAEKNYQHLINHIYYNNIKNITVIKKLVGEKINSQAKFFENKSTAAGMNSIAKRSKDTALYTKTLIPQTNLDAYCKQFNLKPDVIKIDVEGAEINVLQGAKQIINQYKPKIILSTHPRELKELGHSENALLKIINDMGYCLYNINYQPISHISADEYLMLPV